MDKIKRIDIKEFREKGYLQEVNRRFLHPLGLALEVTINESGQEIISGVWDYREDEEGIHYGLIDSEAERKKRFKKNKEFVDLEIEKRYTKRRGILGFDVEPIPTSDE